MSGYLENTANINTITYEDNKILYNQLRLKSKTRVTSNQQRRESSNAEAMAMTALPSLRLMHFLHCFTFRPMAMKEAFVPGTIEAGRTKLVASVEDSPKSSL